MGDIADELVAKIAGRARSLRTGDGRRGADMGPLVTAAHRDRVAGFVDAGEHAGATVVVDGRQGSYDAEGSGFFLGPTLFDHVTPEMPVDTEEIFGPVLCVVRVDTYDEAIELVNNNPHAHGTEGVNFFTRGKVVTTRWLDPSHGGINLRFLQNG